MTTVVALALLLQAAAGFPVAGTVVHGVTGKPINGATVVLMSRGDSRFNATTITDANGRFQFARIEKGKYSLAVRRLGFVTQMYKVRNLYQGYSSGIVVEDKVDNSHLVFKLIPGAVITGTITDETAEPASNVLVQAWRIIGVGSARRLGPFVNGGWTDDRGYFRLHGLPAGSYLLSVSGRPYYTRSLTLNAAQGYPITFYPGTLTADRAEMIRLAPGQEFTASMALRTVLAGTLKVEVSGPYLPDSVVRLSVPSSFGGNFVLGGPTQITGRLARIDNVPYGRYNLSLSAEQDHPVARIPVEVSAPETTVTIGATKVAQVTAKVQIRGGGQPGSTPTVLLTGGGQQYPYTRPVGGDGVATFGPVFPGRYRVSVVAGARRLDIISAKAAGAAAAGDSWEVPETGKVEFEIVADANAPDVTGRAVFEGRAQAGLLVLLAPKKNLDNSTLYRFDQTNSDGSFEWKSVPAGEYLMFSFAEGDAAEYSSAEALRPYLSKAQPLVVTGAAKQTVEFVVPEAARP